MSGTPSGFVSCGSHDIVLPMVSHYSNDLDWAVIPQETQQCASKGSEQDCKLVNIDVNKAGDRLSIQPVCIICQRIQ